MFTRLPSKWSTESCPRRPQKNWLRCENARVTIVSPSTLFKLVVASRGKFVTIANHPFILGRELYRLGSLDLRDIKSRATEGKLGCKPQPISGLTWQMVGFYGWV